MWPRNTSVGSAFAFHFKKIDNIKYVNKFFSASIKPGLL